MTEGQNFDTTYTKIYVGGLPWATRNDGLIRFFQQFGEITHANVVCDRQTQRSKGYGFVTFKDAESATRACIDPNPIIEGRRANCKLASDGENIKRNEFNYPLDDLCYLSQSYMQNQQKSANLQQPLPPYYGPYYWNQQYHPQPHYYAPYHPQPQYYAPYHPQSQYVPYYPQYMNMSTENQTVSQASTSTSLTSRTRSSLE